MFTSLMRQLSRNKVTVLLFHKVPRQPDLLAPQESDFQAFEQVMDFLCAHYRILPLSDVVASLGSGKLPSGSVSITFDDGYADWMDGVIPALERRNAHATLFLTTGQLAEGGMPMWHERIRNAVHGASTPLLDVSSSYPELPVATLTEKRSTVSILDMEYKYLELAEREARLQSLERQAGCCPTRLPRLGAEQVRMIANRGFAIGAHTENHPILALSSEAEARHEFGAARETLQSITGQRVDCLAYPNGRERDFNRSHVDLARAAGYTSAVTTVPGAIGRDTSPFYMPRFTPWGPDPLRMYLQMSRNLMRGVTAFSRGEV